MTAIIQPDSARIHAIIPGGPTTEIRISLWMSKRQSEELLKLAGAHGEVKVAIGGME